MKTKLFQYAFLACALFGFGYSHADPMVLKKCGKIVANDLGLFDYNPINLCKFDVSYYVCPKQIDSIKKYNVAALNDPKKTIRFLKLSLRSLNDGNWVVSGDDTVYFHDDDQSYSVTLSQIDLQQYSVLKAKYPSFPVFRLSDYLAEAGAETEGGGTDFCWMLNTKTPPNQQLLQDMRTEKITENAMIEVTTNEHSLWLDQNSGGGIYYSTRVSNDSALNDVNNWLKEGKLKDMYMVEVDPNDKTEALVPAVNQAGLISELDSMPYARPAKEIKDSACDVTLNNFKSAMTLTNRPETCIVKHNHDNVFDGKSKL